MSPRVVLVGPPGSGKSTIGKILAERLEVAFKDTDAEIEATAGQSITDIFVEHGEERFRELEREAVAAGLAEHEGVLALGGGAILDPATRLLLRDHTVVYLDVDLHDAAKRVGFNRDRPLLIQNPRAQLKALMDARRPLYEEVAMITVSTTGESPEVAAAAILEALK